MNFMKRFLNGSALIVISLWILPACGGGGLDFYGCRSDSDCKHDRICVEGQCQYPDPACTADDDCPQGQDCFGGLCTVCDADSDGIRAPECLGADCDDHNPSIKPGALELCGDALDNDCDGATDPASLCAELCADVVCQEGWACDPLSGECVPICSPHCSGKQCGPDGCGGSCGQCEPGQYCSQDGKCFTSCQDQCEDGDSQCVANAVVHCADTNGDGCTEWSTPSKCLPDERCQDGQCIQSECRDECAMDESYCADQVSVIRCGQFDQDPCLEFGKPEYCDTGYCDWVTGACAQCNNQCLIGERLCWDDYSYVLCNDYDGDGCYEFSDPIECQQGRCDWDSGQCTGGCSDQCYLGEQYCFDDRSIVVCDDWNNDGCMEFSPPIMCDSGLCDWQSGMCTDSCRDECQWGEQYCYDDWSYVECGQYDEDPCLEMSPPIRCEDEPCDPNTGSCGGTCQDECQWGEQYCWDDYSFVFCDDFNGDGCAEFSPPMPCGSDTCDWNTGMCSDTCQDECQWGEQYCWDNRSFITCGEYDGDPCLEFGNPQRCPQGQSCNWDIGRCDDCKPRSCQEQFKECGSWPDGCGNQIYCGDCPGGMYCNQEGRCIEEGQHPGAGQPCDTYNGCPQAWDAAWMCVENPGSTRGFCSYPCETDADCNVDFPVGCCRELAPGHKACMENDYLCTVTGLGYLEHCGDPNQYDCLPDLICIDLTSSQSSCLITCDVAMGYCPNGGNCIPFDQGSATGVCIPTGDGQFGDPCTYEDSCVSGLLCTPLDENHPGYCNTMCNDFLPCPLGFDCILDDGAGGTWCAELCARDEDCARLGAWECVFPYGGDTGVCLPLPN